MLLSITFTSLIITLFFHLCLLFSVFTFFKKFEEFKRNSSLRPKKERKKKKKQIKWTSVPYIFIFKMKKKLCKQKKILFVFLTFQEKIMMKKSLWFEFQMNFHLIAGKLNNPNDVIWWLSGGVFRKSKSFINFDLMVQSAS